MKVLIIGATGLTGQILIKQALAVGHSVTAFAHDPAKITTQHPNVKVVQGDVLQPATLNEAMPGQEAVISVLGPPPPRTAASTVASEGTKNIIAAMEKHGVRRFVCVTIFGIGSSQTFFRRLILNLFFKQIAQDRERQEAIVRQSSLDWVIVRPTRLVDKPQPGKRKVVPEGKAGSIRSTDRTDLADFMLEQLSDDQYLHQAPAVGGN